MTIPNLNGGVESQTKRIFYLELAWGGNIWKDAGGMGSEQLSIFAASFVKEKEEEHKGVKIWSVLIKLDVRSRFKNKMEHN